MFARTRSWLRRQHDSHRACVMETLRESWAHSKSLDKKQFLRQLFARRWWPWWGLLAVVIAVSVALSIYHDRIAEAIRPFSDNIADTQGTWAVPVALLVIVSIPPLVGHEIIILVVGIIWGLWWGFLIAVVGTFAGEILCYYMFKHGFRARAAKIEASSRMYGDLANIMRQKGLWMVTLVRFSAIPGHITTAIQSTIGISVWIFGIAAALSLPKQLILVYLGVLFGKSKDLPLNSSESVLRAGHESARTRTIVSWAVLLITGWMTVMAVYIIWYYIWLMRKEEAAKQAQAIHTATISSSGASILEDDKHPGDAFVREGVSTPSSQYSSLPFYFASVDGHEADNPSSASLPSYEQGGKKGASAVTTRSRSGTGRSRSGTLASLAFSNNSLPYLPYTPMVELPSNIQMAPSRLPSPMPAAMMASSPPDGAQAAEEIEMLPATESDGSSTARLRRIRLARSNSDLSLSVVEARGEDYDSLGQLGPSKANLSVTSTTTVTASARPRSRQRSSTLSISTLPPDLNAEGGVTEEK